MYHAIYESYLATNCRTQSPAKSFWKAGDGSMVSEADPARCLWDRCLLHQVVTDDRFETERACGSSSVRKYNVCSNEEGRNEEEMH